MNDNKDHVILLRKGGKISMVKIEDLDKSTKKDSDVKYVVIDVGLYEPEYLVIPRETFIRKFKEAVISYDYHIEVYCDGLTNSSESRPGIMVCKNVVDFYRAVHSLKKISASNILLHDDYYAVAVEGKLSNVDIFINIKDKIRDINIESTSEADSKYDIIYVIETLNYMVYGDSSIPIIPGKASKYSISIDVQSGRWKCGIPIGNIMSVYQPYFECTSFISSDDFILLTQISEYHVIVTDYVLIQQNQLPFGETIDSTNISEYDGYYLEVLRENEVCAHIFTTENLIEVLVNLKYIYNASYLESEAIYGLMDVRGLLTISYTFRKTESAPNYGSVITFNYDINEEKANSSTRIYENFMKKLRKNYKKFMRGEALEDG